jgi:hypothetical protein
MPGPAPKNQALRQRRNKASSRSLLPVENSPITHTPPLPKNPAGEWDELTRQWWKDIWSSPQHHEFLRADLGALWRLAILTDVFWKTGKLEVAKEIRLLEHEFGLTPLSRRRLEWSVEQVEQAQAQGDRVRSKQAIVVGGSDPRELLKK